MLKKEGVARLEFVELLALKHPVRAEVNDLLTFKNLRRQLADPRIIIGSPPQIETTGLRIRRRHRGILRSKAFA